MTRSLPRIQATRHIHEVRWQSCIFAWSFARYCTLSSNGDGSLTQKSMGPSSIWITRFRECLVHRMKDVIRRAAAAPKSKAAAPAGATAFCFSIAFVGPYSGSVFVP